MTDLNKIRAAQVRAAEAAAIADLPPELLNGMTEQETAQTASVAGLTAAIPSPQPAQKRWTMPDGKTRAASQGPWIARDDMAAFKAFAVANGHEVREHPGLYSSGYQVRHQGHWMGLLWNKHMKRYTADRRLSLLVQSFAADKATGGQA